MKRTERSEYTADLKTKFLSIRVLQKVYSNMNFRACHGDTSEYIADLRTKLLSIRVLQKIYSNKIDVKFRPSHGDTGHKALVTRAHQTAICLISYLYHFDLCLHDFEACFYQLLLSVRCGVRLQFGYFV